MAHGTANQFAMLVHVDRGGFPRGADDYNGVGLLIDVKINQLAQAVKIEAAILVHGGDDGDNGSGNHGRQGLGSKAHCT